MQVVSNSDGQDRQHPELEDTPEDEAKRPSLRPLLRLRPYLLRHKGMLAAAFVEGFEIEGFGAAMWGAVALGIMNFLVGMLLG